MEEDMRLRAMEGDMGEGLEEARTLLETLAGTRYPHRIQL